MRKLDSTTYRAMPWKNGGGTTIEALTVPEGATLETFELRLSMAHVEKDGPFSEYPGIDRTLVVTRGAGVTLETTDGARVELDPASAPFAFTGDDPVHATLASGPISDFNVMTRRSLMQHRVARIVLDEARTLACSGALAVMLVLEGEVVTEAEASEIALIAGDIVTLSPGDASIAVRPHHDGRAASVLIVDVFRR